MLQYWQGFKSPPYLNILTPVLFVGLSTSKRLKSLGFDPGSQRLKIFIIFIYKKSLLFSTASVISHKYGKSSGLGKYKPPWAA